MYNNIEENLKIEFMLQISNINKKYDFNNLIQTKKEIDNIIKSTKAEFFIIDFNDMNTFLQTTLPQENEQTYHFEFNQNSKKESTTFTNIDAVLKNVFNIISKLEKDYLEKALISIECLEGGRSKDNKWSIRSLLAFNDHNNDHNNENIIDMLFWIDKDKPFKFFVDNTTQTITFSSSALKKYRVKSKGFSYINPNGVFDAIEYSDNNYNTEKCDENLKETWMYNVFTIYPNKNNSWYSTYQNIFAFINNKNEINLITLKDLTKNSGYNLQRDTAVSDINQCARPAHKVAKEHLTMGADISENPDMRLLSIDTKLKMQDSNYDAEEYIYAKYENNVGKHCLLLELSEIQGIVYIVRKVYDMDDSFLKEYHIEVEPIDGTDIYVFDSVVGINKNFYEKIGIIVNF